MNTFNQVYGALKSQMADNINISAVDIGLDKTGTTDIHAVLSAYHTAQGSTPTDLYFPAGTYKLSTSTTQPANFRYIMANGAMFSVDSGKTLTVNGGVEAGVYQIFSGDGTVEGTPIVDCAYVEWFGAAGGTTDDFESINKTIAFANRIFIFKDLLIKNALTLTGKNRLTIDSEHATIKSGNLAQAATFNGCSNLKFKNLTFDGDNNTTKLLKFIDCTNAQFINCTFKNMKAVNVSQGFVYGCCFSGCNVIKFIDCEFDNCDGTASSNLVSRFIVFENHGTIPTQYVDVIRCKFDHVYPVDDGDAIYFSQADYPSYANIEKCTFIDCAKRGVKCQSSDISIKNCRFLDATNLYNHDCAISFFYGNCVAEGNQVNYTNATKGILVSNTANIDGIQIIDNVIHISAAPITTQDGISIGGVNYTYEYTRIFVKGNIIKGTNYRYGIYFPRGSNSKIVNNTIEDGGVVVGLTNQATYLVSDVLVDGNTIRNAGGPAISLRGSRITVINNDINTASFGIYTDGNCDSNDNLIDNNVFKDVDYGVYNASTISGKSTITKNIFRNITTKDVVIFGFGHNVKLNSHEKGVTNSGINCEVVTTKTSQQAAAPTTGTWAIADRIVNSVPTVGQPKAWICTVGGTNGTLNSGSTTGSIESASATLTVNSATGLNVGQKITIAGVTGIKTITAISGTTVTIDVVSDATVTDAAVAFSNATFVSEGNL